jgi:hypothetical protein
MLIVVTLLRQPISAGGSACKLSSVPGALRRWRQWRGFDIRFDPATDSQANVKSKTPLETHILLVV